MRISLLVPFGFLAGGLLCRCFLRSAPSGVSVDLAQPLIVVTYWKHFGALMWLALFLAIAIAAIGYVGVLRASIASTGSVPLDRLTMRRICALCALGCTAALAFPVIFSSDVYAYAGYGDMALHGINPYVHQRIALRDPVLDAMQWQWGNPPPICVYGPAFVLLARIVVALLAHFGAAAPLWGLRVLACIALVACAPLAHAAFARFSPRRRLAAAAGIALNPIAIWSCAEGHNDVFMLAAVLAGFAVVARSRPFTGAFVIAASALIKAPAIIAALVLGAWSRNHARFKRFALGASAGIAFSCIVAAPLELGAIDYASKLTRSAPSIPALYPWYALWFLPLAFIFWRTPAASAILAGSLVVVLRYYPDATTALSPQLSAALLLCKIGTPLAVFSVHTAYRNRVRRAIRTPVPRFAAPRSP